MAGHGGGGSLSNVGKNTDIKRPMDFPSLTPAQLVRRYKRFLADVELPGREGVVCVHCPNTGAMTGCQIAGARIWLSSHDSPKRKLPWTWELIETEVGVACIHSARANRVVEEGLLRGLFPELMGPQGNLQREARLGHRSRADFLIPASPDIFIEVKAVTLHLGGGRGAFPDAVSRRATRHIAELCDEIALGRRAALILCVLHAGISSVQVAGHIDVIFAEALGHGMRKGLEVYALFNDITSRGIYPRHAERLEALTI